MVLHNWQVFFVFCRFYLRRENMKKTTSLLLVLAMVFVLSLAGCGDNSAALAVIPPNLLKMTVRPFIPSKSTHTARKPFPRE
jgi:uncharacterized lipoprotein YajG